MPESINNGFTPLQSRPGLHQTGLSKEKQPESSSVTGLKKACSDFESIFINQMMQQMRKTVPENSLFGGGQAEEMMTSMLDDEMAKSISQQRGIGLADVLFQQLKLQLGDE